MKPKILIALDGSEAATRALEHVGQIVCGDKPFEITLCHVVGLPPAVLEHPRGGNRTKKRSSQNS